MAPKRKPAKKLSKADKIREFLDQNLYADNETVGSVGVQMIKLIVGVAETDELVEVLNLLERGAPVQAIRDLLGMPGVEDDDVGSDPTS